MEKFKQYIPTQAHCTSNPSFLHFVSPVYIESRIIPRCEAIVRRFLFYQAFSETSGSVRTLREVMKIKEDRNTEKRESCKRTKQHSHRDKETVNFELFEKERMGT